MAIAQHPTPFQGCCIKNAHAVKGESRACCKSTFLDCIVEDWRPKVPFEPKVDLVVSGGEK